MQNPFLLWAPLKPCSFSSHSTNGSEKYSQMCCNLPQKSKEPPPKHCVPFLVAGGMRCNNMSFMLEGTSWNAPDRWIPKNVTNVVWQVPRFSCGYLLPPVHKYPSRAFRVFHFVLTRYDLREAINVVNQCDVLQNSRWLESLWTTLWQRMRELAQPSSKTTNLSPPCENERLLASLWMGKKAFAWSVASYKCQKLFDLL